MADQERTAVTEAGADDFERWALELAHSTVENMRTLFSVRVHLAASTRQLVGIGDSDDFRSVLAEIRRFRAQVYFDSGRRPDFRTADGDFEDAEQIDDFACHIVCRDPQGQIVGCLRAGRADLLLSSAVEEHLGSARTQKEIRAMGLEKAQVMELGRLAVASDQRRRGVARALLLVSHVLACRLDCLVLWGTAGQGDGQDRYLSKFSSSVLEGSSAKVSKYEDDACVVVHDHRLTLPFIQQSLDIVDRAVFGDGDRV